MHAEPTKSSSAKPTTSLRPATPFFQRQVKIGSANDAAEKEADRTADLVVEGRGLSDGKPFFTAAPPPPPIVNRKEKNEEEEEVQREEKSTAETVAPEDFSTKLQATSQGGTPLPDAERIHMERGFGADFSTVRIHTGTQAAQLSESVNAKAFTHGNNIYFNQGQYNPTSTQGQHLLAHELTHTVQQGASAQQKQTISRKPKQVQRGLLDRAWNAVSDAVSGATEWASDQLQAGIQWVKDQAASFVANMSGYSALCFVLGQDPVSGRAYPRTGLNFLQAILNLIPFGSDFERKLNETGTLAEAGAFLDQQVAGLDLNLGGILSELGAIWRSLGISDVNNPRGVFQRVANVFTSRIQQVITFAGNISRYFLELIKRIVIRELAEFVRARTRAYPLMTVALGRDPITEEAVDRSPQNILQAILNLSPNGQQMYEQIVNSGALARIIAYMTNVGMRAMAIAALAKANALAAWAEITIANLLQPVQTFLHIVQLVAEPAIQLVALITDVVLDFLRMVKDALLGYLGRVAAQVPGFTLLTVILGRNPFTGERVARTPRRLLQGFFELIPGGESYYQQLLASGAIDRMIAWITGAVSQFIEIGASIVQAFNEIWTGFRWADLVNPLAAFERVLNIVRRPVGLIIAFVADVVKQLVLVLLQVMNFPIELIQQLITKVGLAIGIIRRDPLGFLRNLLRALKQGFAQFFENIVTHLLHGVRDWLFAQIADAGITVPEEITPSAIFGMVLQILGVTVERIWQKIVQKIGPERAARLRRMMDVATGVWAFVKDVMTRGPVAIWEYIQNQLSNLWNLVLDAVRNWVITRVIQQVTAKLLTMLDPTGIMAVINSFIAIFRAIQTFIEQLRAMLQLLNSLADGVIQIAMGNIAVAAGFLERSFARGIPIMISFLANQANLRGLGRRIGEMIGRVRAMVDRAIDKLIDKAWQMGKSFLEVAKAGIAAVKNWWKRKKSFVTKQGKSHEISTQGEAKTMKLIMASKDPDEIVKKLQEAKKAHKIGSPEADKIDAAIVAANAAYAAIKSKTEEALKNEGSTGKSKNNTFDSNQAGVFIEKQLAILAKQLELCNLDETEKDLPPSFVRFEQTGGKASKVVAEPLTKIQGNTAGSQPGQDPKGFNVGQYLNKQGKSEKGHDSIQWVRAHLLNDNLHGPGVSWNLVPGRQALNGAMKDGPEKDVKGLVEKGGVHSYEVSITYHNAEKLTDLDDKVIGNAEDFPSKVNIVYHKAEENPNTKKFEKVASTRKEYPVDKGNAVPDTKDLDPESAKQAIVERITDYLDKPESKDKTFSQIATNRHLYTLEKRFPGVLEACRAVFNSKRKTGVQSEAA